MQSPHISLVAAISENGVIGRHNQLPWHVRSDLMNFKKITLGKPVVMGRKTFESLGSPLKGRPNLVVTRDRSFVAPGVQIFTSVEDALEFARGIPAEEIMVIGGEQIFNATLARADRMYLTRIHTVVADGDAYFPHFPESEWRKKEEITLPGRADELRADFATWHRIAA